MICLVTTLSQTYNAEVCAGIRKCDRKFHSVSGGIDRLTEYRLRGNNAVVFFCVDGFVKV